MTHAPLHGTSGKWNNQWKVILAYFGYVPLPMPPGPIDTNRQDYLRAVANRGWFL